METQPPMQSFKQFLQTQDDNISDEEAISKYNEYKLDFKRLQLNEFFVAHKDEEWLVFSSILVLKYNYCVSPCHLRNLFYKFREVDLNVDSHRHLQVVLL